MLICHFSDFHGEWYLLPEADVYICTGDMLDNYPTKNFGGIDRNREIFLQAKALRKIDGRQYLGNPKAPVVICRGNHDFVSLARLFDGGDTYEMGDEATLYTINGVHFGGVRGINAIGNDNTWADELDFTSWVERTQKLAVNIDILVTHAPPYGILDGAYGGDLCGSTALHGYLQRRMYTGKTNVRLHCFGHIHEAFGQMTNGGGGLNKVHFSNAARGHALFEFSNNELSPKELKQVLA